jgi:hypothetical protein
VSFDRTLVEGCGNRSCHVWSLLKIDPVSQNLACCHAGICPSGPIRRICETHSVRVSYYSRQVALDSIGPFKA